MEYTKGAILDRDVFRVKHSHSEPAPEQAPTATMRRCNTILELEQDLASLEAQMQVVQNRLNAFAQNNEIATRESVVETRNEWQVLTARMWIRQLELQESRIHGKVLDGSFERAQAEIERIALESE